MNYEKTRHAKKLLRLMNKRWALRIFDFLSEKPCRTVTEIQMRLRVEQPVVSQFLMELRDYNLVLCTRKGNFIYYSLNLEEIERISGIISSWSVAYGNLNAKAKCVA